MHKMARRVLYWSCSVITLCVLLELSTADLAPPYNLLKMEVDQYILPPIKFELESFEPYIDSKTMRVHIFGHHDGYKTKTNNFLKEWREEEPDNKFARESILKIVQNLDKVPEKYREKIRNNGGGFVNHCFYFGILSPNDESVDRVPTGDLLEDINAQFGDLEGLKKAFVEELKQLFGSGYVWLTRKPGAPRPNLAVSHTRNQDSPVSQGLQPILVLDLWEHAYYIKHNYKKWEHLKDFWMVVDWNFVSKLDQWWKDFDKEQEKADKRVAEMKAGMEKRLKEEEIRKQEKKEKRDEKKGKKEEKKEL